MNVLFGKLYSVASSICLKNIFNQTAYVRFYLILKIIIISNYEFFWFKLIKSYSDSHNYFCKIPSNIQKKKMSEAELEAEINQYKEQVSYFLLKF